MPLFAVLFCFMWLGCKPAIASSDRYDINDFKNVYDVDVLTSPWGLVGNSEDQSELSEKELLKLRDNLDDLPKPNDPGYMKMTAASGQEMLCALPNLSVEKVNQRKEVPLDDETILRIYDLIDKDIPRCLLMEEEAIYKFCHGRKVTQFHIDEYGDIRADNNLGIYKDASRKLLMELGDYPNRFAEKYVLGKDCDLGDITIPTTTNVIFECDPKIGPGHAYIHSVKEDYSCHYIMIVKVGALCNLDLLTPYKRAINTIVCRPFITKEAALNILSERLDRIREKRYDITETQAAVALESVARRRSFMYRSWLNYCKYSDYAKKRRWNREYSDAKFNYLSALYKRIYGQEPDLDTKNDMLHFIDTEIVEAEKRWRKLKMIPDTGYVYHTYEDEERGNIWHYFHDPHWNLLDFPRSLKQVDIKNMYADMVKHRREKDDYSGPLDKLDDVLFDFYLRYLNPNKYSQNMLITPAEIFTQFLEEHPDGYTMPIYVAPYIVSYELGYEKNHAGYKSEIDVSELLTNYMISKVDDFEEDIRNDEDEPDRILEDVIGLYTMINLIQMKYEFRDDGFKLHRSRENKISLLKTMAALVIRIKNAYHYIADEFDEYTDREEPVSQDEQDDHFFDVIYNLYPEVEQMRRESRTDIVIRKEELEKQKLMKIIYQSGEHITQKTFDSIWKTHTKLLMYTGSLKFSEDYDLRKRSRSASMPPPGPNVVPVFAKLEQKFVNLAEKLKLPTLMSIDFEELRDGMGIEELMKLLTERDNLLEVMKKRASIENAVNMKKGDKQKV